MKPRKAPNPQRTALYVRVSTGAQEEEGTSLLTQEQGCRRFAEAHGLAVDEASIFREVHTGVELWERPQLTRLREAIRHHQVSHVIAYAIDRLARDPTHLGVILSEAAYHGVQVSFVTEQLDDTPEGQLIRFVRGYAAKVEHEKIRERSMRGKRARLEAGKLHNHAGDLYGYTRDKAAGVRILAAEEAAVVRQVFRWVGEERRSIRWLIRELNNTGVPPPSAGKRVFAEPSREPRWGKGAVQRILREVAYTGETWTWRLKRVKGQGLELRSKDEWIRLPDGVTPPIVSPELFQAVHERLSTNQGAATRNERRPYLLRGLIFCGVCGRAMRACPEGERRMYRCSSRETPAGPCGGRRVPADEVEAWVWEEVAGVLRDPSTVVAEVERRKAQEPDPAVEQEVVELGHRVSELDAQLARLVEALAEDTLPRDIVTRESRKRQQEKARLAGRLEELTRRTAEEGSDKGEMVAVSEFCRRVSERLETFAFAERRLALEAVAARVQANGCGRRGSPLEWRVEGHIPVLPPEVLQAEPGILTRTC